MKLLYIYGPPAAGKFTVAQEIARISDCKLFHNHASLNLAHDIYPLYESQLFGLAKQIRLAVIEYAAEQNTNLVFTNVFADRDSEDTAFVRDAVSAVEKHGGEIVFVRLHAPVNILTQRVSAESRKHLRKLTNPEALLYLHAMRDLFVSVPYESLAVDTSVHTPEEAAKLILEYAQTQRRETKRT